jgi:elongation factor P--(R)-beta-lysine ligase
VSTRVAATLRTLERRAAMLSAIRSFFAEREVLEVETPALSPAGVTDPAIESIAATVPDMSAGPLYLQTSPEFAMKRLLAAGSGDIYQICRVFRADELGRWHQPEFTLLEWYRVGFDDERLIGEVAELVAVALHAGAGANGGKRAVVRVRYADAVERVLGVGADAPTPVLAARLRAQGVEVPTGLPHHATLDLALGTVVVASFDPAALTFVHDYPASQAALARLKPTRPPVAARFELFCGGIELANGFHELTDAAEQRRRFSAERAARIAAGRTAPPIDEALLDALTRGLPDCAGVALGVDRLVALAIGASELADAVSLVHERSG